MLQDLRSAPVRQRTRRRGRGRAAALSWATPPALVCAALALFEPAPIRALHDLAFDSFLALKPRAYDPDAPVRIIDIDDESLKRIGQWPWPRTVLARLIEKAGEAGAAAIALDILIAEPDRTSLEQVIAAMPPSPMRNALKRVWREQGAPNDRILAEAIGRYPVVVGLDGSPGGESPMPKKAGFAFAGDPAVAFVRPAFPGVNLPLAPIVAAAAGVGAFNIAADRDLVARRAPTFVRIGDSIAPSLAMEALRVAQQASTYVIRSSNASGAPAFGAHTGIVEIRNGDLLAATDADGAIRIHYAGAQPKRRIAAWKILAGDFPPDDISGRIALIGASAATLQDIRATPLEAAVAGVEVHAELIEHILSGAHLARPDYARGFEATVILLAGLFAGLLSFALPALAGAAGALLLAGALALGAWLFFSQAGLLFDPVLPPLALLGGFASATVSAYRRTERDRARIRDLFGRYVSPAVIEALMADPSRLALGGELRPVTVMFTDIRDFTRRSERLAANEVVRFLNSVHTPLSEAVMRHGGTVDKYIGDGMMAFWNAPLDDPDHVRNGLRAALAILAALPEIARQASAAAAEVFEGEFALGVGLHTGVACVGNLGSLRRLEYSIVGDTVNSAARIEPLCKDFSAPILVSEAVAKAAPDFAFLEIGEAVLRGRQTGTGLFVLLGDEAFARRPDFSALSKNHAAALAAWRSGDPQTPLLIERCETDSLAAPMRGVYRSWREKTRGVSATA